MARFNFFGEGLPGIDLDELKGKLIVLEGTDEFDKMVESYGFEVIDASGSIEEVFQDLRDRVAVVIEGNGRQT